MSDKKHSNMPYTNRELSWLDFNTRVLEEAYEKDNPVLERLKFIAITASNLDEFFMVRVSGLKEQARSGYHEPDASGLTPNAVLTRISEKVHDFVDKEYACFSRLILPALRKNKIFLLRREDLTPTQQQYIGDYFEEVLFPVLTPLAIDQSRPFPLLANRSLNIAVRLDKEADSHFAVVQVPAILPRILEIPTEDGQGFVMLENIIIEHLDQLFSPYTIKAVCPFRLTRNTDLDIDDEADDLLAEVRESIKKRKRGKPTRLEITTRCDVQTREFLVEMLKVKKEDIYECPGPLDLSAWMKFSMLPGHDDLRLTPILPVPAGDFFGYQNCFDAIRDGDRLVHHPYESFDCVVDFAFKAAEDPNVLAIKQTLYRVSGNSPIVSALIRAAENGKQVTVLVELKARFDEENNIHWAIKLEQAGCHVIYGLTGLKTHCKILLVVRREEDRIRRYLHLGTGNYNDTTARLYTDIGFFTCRESFGSDASSLFNVLTGYASPPEYNKIIVAPDGMRNFFERMIDREIDNAQKGLSSGITVKVNSLLDPDIIAHLYRASQAGVEIKLIVRGICSLIPGIKDISENITVISIVGQLLEHSRIFKFHNAGNPKIYLGSADWMPRNLDLRVELLFPVEEEPLKERLFEMLDFSLRDTLNARVQDSLGQYTMVDKRGKGTINSQAEFAKMAAARWKELQEKAQNKVYIPEPQP